MKEIELRNLHLLTEKAAKIQILNENKIQREISKLKKTMLKEQHLKLDAFQRVDELQTTVYNLEDDLKVALCTKSSRPMSSFAKTHQNTARLDDKSTPYPIVTLQRSATSFNFSSSSHAAAAQSLINSRPKSVLYLFIFYLVLFFCLKFFLI